MDQLTLAIARAMGEEGMRAAVAGAEARSPGLTDVMYAYLVKFAMRCERGHRFISEEVTMAYAADAGFEQPKDARAWGGVFLRAVNKGVISVVDYNGVRKLGHGVKGAKRYRSLIIGKRWTEIFPGECS
jgi:hypothetical protein